MAKIVCKKCGLKGSSKCPYCRNVFPMGNRPELEGTDEILSHVAKFDEANHSIILTGYMDVDGVYETFEEILARTWRLMHRVTEEECKILGCIHEWVFDEGEKSDIGCGHDKVKGA